MDVKEELRKYKEMLDEGLITQEDFDKLKNKLLEIDTLSVESKEDDPFKAFKEQYGAEPSENIIKNESPKESKKADIDTSWLHEEYLIPPSSGGNSTGYNSSIQNNTISNNGASIQADSKSAKKKTNGFCIAGGVMGIISVLLINPFCIIAVLGLIFSIIGMVDCRKKRQYGDGYAITGIVLSATAIIVFFISIFTSFTLFGWMKETNLPIGSKSNTSAIVVDNGNTSSAETKEPVVSKQEQAPPVVTLPDLTGNWEVDNCVFPDGTSFRGYETTGINIRFQGLSYVMDFPELNVSIGGDLNYLGSYTDGCFVYDSSEDGTDSVVYYDGILYMYLKLRDKSNNNVMGYYVLVREGESGLGTLTEREAQTLFTTMNTAIETVRKDVK